MDISRGEGVAQCPWLVYSHGQDFENQTFCCNITEPSPVETRHKSIPALHYKVVFSCSHGWLVLYDDDNKLLSLCNASNFDTVIPLPNLDQLSNPDNEIDSCILLSSSPEDIKVLLFLEDLSSVFYCRPGDVKWHEIRYQKQLQDLDYRGSGYADENMFFSYAVGCGNKAYARVCGVFAGGHCWFPEIWSIEIVEEPDGLGLALSKLGRPDFQHTYSGAVTITMLESCRELFSVRFVWGDRGRTETLVVEVYRLNSDTLSWEGVKSVKDRAFFISERYGVSCHARGSGRIYFTNCEDQSLYCYHMEDESIWASLPCPDLPEPCLCCPIWIMPEALVRPEDDQDKNQREDHTERELLETSKEALGNEIISPDEGKKLTDLPFDALKEVIKQFTPIDYMNFRAVSRICQSLAPPLNWLTTALSKSETDSPLPLLMFADMDQSLYKFVDPTLNNSYLMPIQKSVEDMVIRYSNHGWLLLSRKHAVHCYNPLTMGIISCTDTYQADENLFFASKPSASDCFLVSVSFFYEDKVIVSTIGPREDEWTHNELQSNRSFEAKHNSPVFVRDAFYFLDQNGNIGKLKIGEERNNMSWQVLENLDELVKPCANCLDKSFLVECGGELLSVFVSRAGEWVGVYKLNQLENAWETITTLGNYALYLNRTSSFSSMMSPDLGNRIYFPLFRESGIVFFSLDTGKWCFSGSEDELSDLYGTRLHINSCWIQPSWC